jgi:AraC-like DNA-binding protein
VFRGYAPPPPLSRFVELFWYYEGSGPTTGKELILPTGTMQLIVRLGDAAMQVWDRNDRLQVDNRNGTMINGVHSQPFIIDTSDQDALIGVQFRLGGAFPFLGMPSSELKNINTGLDDVWGQRAEELRCRVCEAPTITERFAVMERWLQSMVSAPLVRHRSVKRGLRVLDDPTVAASVADIAADIGLSKRRFIEVFKQQVGLTPKLYARVRRFQSVITSLDDRADVVWPEVAVDCGYFDQAHFIRDFKQFCGLTPGKYLRARGDQRNHVPIE